MTAMENHPHAPFLTLPTATSTPPAPEECQTAVATPGYRTRLAKAARLIAEAVEIVPGLHDDELEEMVERLYEIQNGA